MTGMRATSGWTATPWSPLDCKALVSLANLLALRFWHQKDNKYNRPSAAKMHVTISTRFHVPEDSEDRSYFLSCFLCRRLSYSGWMQNLPLSNDKRVKSKRYRSFFRWRKNIKNVEWGLRPFKRNLLVRLTASNKESQLTEPLRGSS